MALEISNQYLYTGRGPFDAKSLVKTYADLISESTWQVTVENKTFSIAYNGMITSVWKDTDSTKNGVYVLHDPDASQFKAPVVTNEAYWHKIAKVADLTSFVEKMDLFESKLSSFADLDLFQKIDSINDLPTDFSTEDFNPNITYYTYDTATEKLTTYIFVKELPGYKCVTGESSSVSTGRSISKVEINEAGELIIYYSDNTTSNVGKVVGREGGIAAIQIGTTEYIADASGTIVLPNFATVEYVDAKFVTKEELLAADYATKTHVENRIEDSFDDFTESLKTIVLFGGDANPENDE